MNSKVHSPYGLDIIENCMLCPHRSERLFCDLPPEALKNLAAITSSSSYPKGAVLFVEGQIPTGTFILCSGVVKLSTYSNSGKTLISRFVNPGEILGVAATISGKPYVVTAEVHEPAAVKFIHRADFLTFLLNHADATLRAAQQLADNYFAALSELQNIGMSHSAEEKLARFILDWESHHSGPRTQNRFVISLTHEEIASTIGASRETVTRMLSAFRNKRLLKTNGSTFTIVNRSAFEKIVGS
jgi:CRP/FNR family transcriptional regulator, cyclic AMP receptor protein